MGLYQEPGRSDKMKWHGINVIMCHYYVGLQEIMVLLTASKVT